MLREPSYVKSAKKLITPMSRTNLRAVAFNGISFIRLLWVSWLITPQSRGACRKKRREQSEVPAVVQASRAMRASFQRPEKRTVLNLETSRKANRRIKEAAARSLLPQGYKKNLYLPGPSCFLVVEA